MARNRTNIGIPPYMFSIQICLYFRIRVPDGVVLGKLLDAKISGYCPFKDFLANATSHKILSGVEKFVEYQAVAGEDMDGGI
jgi:hypothetical protein